MGLAQLRPDIRSGVRDALELHLRHEATKVSKSRIKRLRGLTRPQFRLRVEEVRVFYDVTDQEVQVLAIILHLCERDLTTRFRHVRRARLPLPAGENVDVIISNPAQLPLPQLRQD